MTARPEKLFIYYPRKCEWTELPLHVGRIGIFGLSLKTQIIVWTNTVSSKLEGTN